MVKNALQKFVSGDSFAKNILTLTTATTLAQILSVLTSPIMARLFTPSDYGVIALYIGIATSASIIATGQYEVSVVLPKKDKNAINVAVLCIILTFLTSVLSLLVIITFNSQISHYIGGEEVSKWLYYIPITVLQTGSFRTLTYWSNRKKYYSNLAKASVAQTLTGVGLKLYAGFGGFGFAGLITSGLISQFIGLIYLAHATINMHLELSKYISIKKIYFYALKYQDFPKFNAPQVFLDSLRENGILFALSTYYDLNVIGYYSLAERVVKLPIGLVSTPISQVFYQELAESQNLKKNLWSQGRNLMGSLSFIALPSMAILVLFSPSLFPQTVVNALPGAVFPPVAEVCVDRLPRREVAREGVPANPLDQHIQNGVDHGVNIHGSRATPRFGGRQEVTEQV